MTDREPPRVVLLNGPPGIGKTTLARRYVLDRPLALALDIDTLRRGLGRWEEHQEAAGQLARALALAMIRTHLAAGHDVVVPQYVARTEFLDALAAAADAGGARFVEVYLTDAREAALERFAARAGDEAAAQHHAEAVRTLGGPAELAAMVDRIEAVRRRRPRGITVPTRAGAIEEAYRSLLAALEAASLRP
ncbi:hypothetical protein DQ239_10655 [Blastococcus sp. TF02-09]|uniref:AAA family ATPase n=1 Tax=Blastococcus sp. TF02-09 TaxID=2250576 RepID=UPI000DEBA0BB|nr:AAA family ATPase [Blastococcus sp. TF02-9]RBY77351.1 hypothetical protein DQ239_10655 [Blastococcus sp. TF02-9]